MLHCRIITTDQSRYFTQQWVPNLYFFNILPGFLQLIPFARHATVGLFACGHNYVGKVWNVLSSLPMCCIHTQENLRLAIMILTTLTLLSAEHRYYRSLWMGNWHRSLLNTRFIWLAGWNDYVRNLTWWSFSMYWVTWSYKLTKFLCNLENCLHICFCWKRVKNVNLFHCCIFLFFLLI